MSREAQEKDVRTNIPVEGIGHPEKAVQENGVTAAWLGEAPLGPAAVTWGVPWKAGELKREEPLRLVSASGMPLPVQSWPKAYYPDGSVKWTAHAVSLGEGAEASYTLSKGESEAPVEGVSVQEHAGRIVVDTGRAVYTLGTEGEALVRSIVRGERTLCTGARLVGYREEESVTEGARVTRTQTLRSRLHRVTVEQRGPVRAVVKFEGRHALLGGRSPREWLPFTVRLYFYAGQESVRAVHTFVYDGDPGKDGVKGIGLSFTLPLEGPLYNRHVRFTGDTGVFAESPKTLMTIRTQGKYQELYRSQTAGENVAFDPQEDARFLTLLDDSAVWDHFKLVQHSADSYTVSKRTGPACSWLKAVTGSRSRGVAYAGSEAGGLALGLRHFWRKHPASLELSGLSGEAAEATAWFWSPDAPAMDLRHYDTTTHLESSYEGFHELRSTPYGVANTNELTFWCLERTPSHEELDAMAGSLERPAQLVCEPQRYHDTGAFGVWSLPSRDTPLQAELEDRLDAAIEFYKAEIEQRRWYGFWDFGDVMHSYDPVRHTWRYDIGGCAWQNTELVPNMWLWLTFLRTGREDVFRLAEAMTRHTSEVDTYHFGEYAGLGSRHNVVHWGCGCKEARISMAGLHRYFYYLTGDERTGDIMEEVVDADYTTVTLDPMRYYFPKDEFPTHTRVGPDWSAFCSNWMTRWERFEDTAYRDKLLVGWEAMKGMPHRLLTGPTFGYDPKTGELLHMSDDNWGRHLMICMGAPQVWFELAELLGDDQWREMLAEFGAFYPLTPEEKAARTGGAIGKQGWDHPVFFTVMMAYAAARFGDEALARRTWDILFGDKLMQRIARTDEVDRLAFVRPLREIPDVSTNSVSQWSLNTIVCLELIGRWLGSGEAGTAGRGGETVTSSS
ncbi:hypothetical protein [Paenibacillus mucilaginosus]|uniref:Tat pathway signal sequence domain protein n=1 Tax=Paenibacillus mucilaginosus (strain KNP414) TaxID=1036673 RepID=F8FLM3_PAEMK|nr:hypothetical protein [Paenibacillus mucilaginosus]AEI44150.1 hypothetical protein KNP414_05626 [Paenibacillus mucilaginosus KNP414]MCG7212383.1 hypothetical protein [Paenibacillus mucilaginosus]WDM25575.1 hypothetical protein KCX80_24395 [Paenibacillus mucilaginosus]